MLQMVKHHAIKTCRRMELYLHAFLISALDGGDFSASWSRHIIPRKNCLVTHWKRGLVTQARYHCASEEESRRNLNPGRPSQSGHCLLSIVRLLFMLSLLILLFFFVT
jgi:hypothetical protein